MHRECIPIRFLVSDGNPSILGLSALHALGHSASPWATSSSISVQSTTKIFIVICYTNKGGVAVDQVILWANGVLLFRKQRVLTYGKREDVSKAMDKMEQQGVVSVSVHQSGLFQLWWQRKVTGRHIVFVGGCRLALNPRLHICAPSTIGAKVHIRQPILLENRPGEYMRADSTVTTVQAIDYNYCSVRLIPIQPFILWPSRIIWHSPSCNRRGDSRLRWSTDLPR